MKQIICLLTLLTMMNGWGAGNQAKTKSFPDQTVRESAVSDRVSNGGASVTFAVPAEVSVPDSWLERHFPGLDPADAVGQSCANGYSVRENYVAGLDPKDPDSRLTAYISVTNDVVYISWEPYLNATGEARLYKVNGKRALTDADWHWPSKLGDHFFRVTVEMPNGTDPSDKPGRFPPDKPFTPVGVQLWENGPYFSPMNIGAKTPWDAGLYFWWGDTVGYKREGEQWVASDGSNSDFSFDKDNAESYLKDKDILLSEGWITSSGVLTPSHDAARVHWGKNWRIPTAEEVDAMVKNTTSEWITTNGVTGRLVRGKGSFSQTSIFLPASGGGNEKNLTNFGVWGYFWSSSPNLKNNDRAWRLFFKENKELNQASNLRYIGQPIRPVFVSGE